MRLTMKARKVFTQGLPEQYRRSSKKEKGEILKPVVSATGYDAHYAAWVLRHHGKRVEVEPGIVLEGDVRRPASTARRWRRR